MYLKDDWYGSERRFRRILACDWQLRGALILFRLPIMLIQRTKQFCTKWTLEYVSKLRKKEMEGKWEGED